MRMSRFRSSRIGAVVRRRRGRVRARRRPADRGRRGAACGAQAGQGPARPGRARRRQRRGGGRSERVAVLSFDSGDREVPQSGVSRERGAVGADDRRAAGVERGAGRGRLVRRVGADRAEQGDVSRRAQLPRRPRPLRDRRPRHGDGDCAELLEAELPDVGCRCGRRHLANHEGPLGQSRLGVRLGQLRDATRSARSRWTRTMPRPTRCTPEPARRTPPRTPRPAWASTSRPTAARRGPTSRPAPWSPATRGRPSTAARSARSRSTARTRT